MSRIPLAACSRSILTPGRTKSGHNRRRFSERIGCRHCWRWWYGLTSGPIYTTQQDGTRLGTIDRSTGAGTDIGPFGTTETFAAAFDTDGTLYTTINGFSGNAVLASVDQTTGSATPIGSGLGTSMISLEVAADGTMYGIGYNDRILYEIDQTTGSATPVGDTGISFNMDLAVDSAGVMYATFGNNIWTVDTATGNSTLLGTFSGILSGTVMGIMFDETDTAVRNGVRGRTRRCTKSMSTRCRRPWSAARVSSGRMAVTS